ncbi:MAG TPA: cytochrome c-type biogenesis CcmF C-terminal domain-containing protein, partial [Longimicrobiales bacterium]|nr:cytochrome c-type biogenesis CcmF C-terminal domain-containing protein [Longimicrobiales bacterium]
TFAENTTIAFIFLTFMGSLIAWGAVMVIYRLPKLKSENQIESFLSRESAFLFNNLILVAATFAVAWGTLLPLISEGFFGEQITVGPPFFNRINVPFGIILLALMGIGPVIAWRRASAKNLKKNFLWPTAFGLVVSAILWYSGVRHGLALTTFGLSAFVLYIIVVEFWKGTKARARIEGEGFLPAFYHLISRNRRRWGGYIVHAGVVFIFAAFAAEPFYVEVQQTMQPGEVTELKSPLGATYRLTYEGTSSNVRDPDQNLAWQAVALVTVERNGEMVGPMRTEKRGYIRPEGQSSTEVGIHSRPLEDLYITLADVNLQGIIGENDPSAQAATFTFMIKPLVGWIWAGLFILMAGSMIGLWPSTEKVRPSTATARGAVPDAAPAGD